MTEDEGAEAAVAEFRLDEADFSKAWSHVPTFKKLRRVALLCIFMLPVLMFGPLLSRDPRVRFTDGLPSALLGLLCVCLGVAYLALAPGAWAKNALKNLGTGTVRLTLDDAGLRWASAERKVEVTWSEVPRVVDAVDAFLVYTGTDSVLFVPKGALSAAGLARLSTRLGERATAATAGRSTRVATLIVLMVVVFALTLWRKLAH